MRRSRVALSTALAASALVLPAAPSAGAPPEDYELDVTIPAGGFCDFTLQVEASGKTKVLDRGDYVMITSPRTVAVLTNVDTGASTTLRLGGKFKDTDAGGGAIASVSTGRSIVLTSNAGAVLLVGRYEFTLNEVGLVGEYEGSGKIIDLCARLS